MESLLDHMVVTSGIALIVVSLCVVTFYSVLSRVGILLLRFEGFPRLQIFITIIGSLIAHILCIWLFAIAYYVMDHGLNIGDLAGQDSQSLIAFLHFSSATYSSVGWGDLYPAGASRMLAGLEAVVGLMLIGWSVAYTYFVVDKYLLHHRTRHLKRLEKQHDR